MSHDVPRNYSQPSSGTVSTNTVVICITALTIVGVAAVLALFLGSQGEDNSVTLARAGIITGFIGVLLPQLLLLVRQDRVTQVVEAVKDDTHSILNGAGQAKIEAALHNVLNEREQNAS